MTEENVNPNNIQEGDFVTFTGDDDKTKMTVQWIDLDPLRQNAKCIWLDKNKHLQSEKFPLKLLQKI